MAKNTCPIEGCERKHYSQGLCQSHYKQLRRPPRAVTICLVDDCDRPSDVRGWCTMHYQRWQRHGDPLVVRSVDQLRPACRVPACARKAAARGYCQVHWQEAIDHGVIVRRVHPSAAERVWMRFDRDVNGCWLWNGSVQPNGYGTIARAGHGNGREYAHRFVYTLLVGPIPDGMCIDHLCRIKRCVNPAHLEVVSYSENILRGLHSELKTHCANGHPRTPENLVRNGRRGSTRCKICNNERGRASRRAAAKIRAERSS